MSKSKPYIYYDDDMTVAVCSGCFARIKRTRENPYIEPRHDKKCKLHTKLVK